MLTQLNREWQALVDQPWTTPWHADCPGLANCHDLDDVLACCEDDHVAGFLLRICQSRAANSASRAAADLAGRIVLQATLGRLVRLTQRTPGTELADFVSAAWLRIRVHPIDRRPAKVLTNLSLDALKAVTRQRARLTVEVPVDPVVAHVLHDESTHPVVRASAVIRSAEEMQLITAKAGAILRSVYLLGLSSAEAATVHGTNAALIRYYCSAALKRLRRNASSLVIAT